MEFVIGVDLSGTQISAAAAARDGHLLARTQTEARPGDGPEAGLERIALQIKYVASQAGLDPRQALAIGIGAPAPVDFPISERLQARFGARVLVTQAHKAAGLGEHRYGAGRGTSEMLYLEAGTAIGGCIITGGKVLEGAGGRGGELGHMLADAGGPPCHCGARGCLEAIASGWAIGRAGQEVAMKLEGERIRMLAGGDPRKVNLAAVARAAEYGDLAALMIMDRAAKVLGMALGGLINLLGPERVVLGGSVITVGGRLLLAKLAEAARKQTLPGSGCPFVTAELGTDSAVRGAVALALESVQ